MQGADVQSLVRERDPTLPQPRCGVDAKSLQSCTTLGDPMDRGLLGSSVHGVLQARILEWIAISSSRGPSQLKDRTHVSCVGKHLFNTEPPGKPDIYIYIFSRCLLS